MAAELPELIWIGLLFFALGLCFVIRKFVHAIFSPIIAVVGFVPGLGGAIAGALATVEQAISGALGSAEAQFDSLIGASWHQLARQLDWLWNTLKESANLIAALAILTSPLVQGYLAIRHLINSVHGTVHGIHNQLRTLTREYKGIEGRVKTLEHDWSRGIEGNVHKRLKALEREVSGIDDTTIPGLRTAVNDAKSLANTAIADVEAIPFPASARTWAEAVALALPALGLEWLRCNSNPMNGNRNACGLWSRLSSLLGLAAFLTIAFDFQEFVQASEEVATFIGSAVNEFEGAFPLSLPPLPPPQ